MSDLHFIGHSDILATLEAYREHVDHARFIGHRDVDAEVRVKACERTLNNGRDGDWRM